MSKVLTIFYDDTTKPLNLSDLRHVIETYKGKDQRKHRFFCIPYKSDTMKAFEALYQTFLDENKNQDRSSIERLTSSQVFRLADFAFKHELDREKYIRFRHDPLWKDKFLDLLTHIKYFEALSCMYHKGQTIWYKENFDRVMTFPENPYNDLLKETQYPSGLTLRAFNQLHIKARRAISLDKKIAELREIAEGTPSYQQHPLYKLK